MRGAAAKSLVTQRSEVKTVHFLLTADFITDFCFLKFSFSDLSFIKNKLKRKVKTRIKPEQLNWYRFLLCETSLISFGFVLTFKSRC